MKVAVVPAQVTTVEDRIAGNLGFNQLLLLSFPIFVGSGLYIILPPYIHSATYKLFLILALVLTCAFLAIRYKGKIILHWLVIIFRYNLRPGYYVFNKNSLRRCENPIPKSETSLEERKKTPEKYNNFKPLSLSTVVRLQAILDNPNSKLSFVRKRGAISVLITEIKD